ncbi:hypothetical protein [Halobacillus litoralis]|uniref:Uncharacterized protein n=1 Tax=Halobacillus litoralis TaxID=45668 RepID=A0A410MI63_9BACI|nr:hypothetical protein [Halobacillus litoralis]QAS54383.1 hypothetical protein HLI_20265 [Halobacillus litoralis]
MTEQTLKKVRSVLLYIAFVALSLLVSYLLAYPAGYAPLGYGVISKQEETVKIQPYNTWGIEKEPIIFQPVEGEEWEMKRLVDLIEKQDMWYLMFFASCLIALYMVGTDLLKGETLKKVAWEKCICRTVSSDITSPASP